MFKNKKINIILIILLIVIIGVVIFAIGNKKDTLTAEVHVKQIDNIEIDSETNVVVIKMLVGINSLDISDLAYEFGDRDINAKLEDDIMLYESSDTEKTTLMVFNFEYKKDVIDLYNYLKTEKNSFNLSIQTVNGTIYETEKDVNFTEHDLSKNIIAENK